MARISTTTTSISRRVLATKLKESRAQAANSDTQKSFNEMQETLRLITELKDQGLITQPKFNVALLGEVNLGQ